MSIQGIAQLPLDDKGSSAGGRRVDCVNLFPTGRAMMRTDAEGQVMYGFLTVLAVALVITATCCLWTSVAQADDCGQCSPCLPTGYPAVPCAGRCNQSEEVDCSGCVCRDLQPGVGTNCNCVKWF